MRSMNFIAAAIMAAAMFAGGHALAANVCQTDHLTCATTMPVDGYCQCRGHGATEDGTVVANAPHTKMNSTAGGCGASPNAPGCR